MTGLRKTLNERQVEQPLAIEIGCCLNVPVGESVGVFFADALRRTTMRRPTP